MKSGRDPELTRDTDLKRDLEAAVQTRKELGEGYEAELVDSFLEKVEQRIESTVDKRVRRQLAEQQMVIARGGRPSQSADAQGPGVAFGLAALSLVLAIPLSAIAAVQTGLAGLFVCWAGVVGVNACFLGHTKLRGDGEKKSDWD
ncbi:hypothetical protein FH609_014460 [Streptomyces sp. 3MP-14]|uniref:Uncharacterized protein n=1 Tax=Streptomyces mimosae TaxID=2586635 RepID=A0A5N5ZWI2_9ACTN|nr:MULTISPECIES: hypothetical protein [Streptomyces]KAB8160163.1 hypothetical protein FH607_027650 [Streptomyces mimosae]KAB8176668.1 hypothetical protein FH609_014460 [Streptomyces sp. 3MP-14]